MEQPSKKEKSKVSSEKRKNSLEQSKANFWHRLKNLTFESPKTVVYEGDTVRLIPITQETAVVKDDTKCQVSVLSEKQVSILQETAVTEVEIERPVLVPPEKVVKKDISEIDKVIPRLTLEGIRIAFKESLNP